MKVVMPSLPKSLTASLEQRTWPSPGGEFAVGRLPSSPLSLLLWNRASAAGCVVAWDTSSPQQQLQLQPPSQHAPPRVVRKPLTSSSFVVVSPRMLVESNPLTESEHIPTRRELVPFLALTRKSRGQHPKGVSR